MGYRLKVGLFSTVEKMKGGFRSLFMSLGGVATWRWWDGRGEGWELGFTGGGWQLFHAAFWGEEKE